MAGGGAHAVHSVGLLILLSGFALALIGYRLPWLIAIFRTLQARDTRNTTRDNSHGALNPVNGVRSLQLTLAFAVFLVFGLVPLSVGILLLTPHFIAGLFIATVTFALAAAAVVVIASGTPLQRAFGIGAAIPLLLAVCNFAIYGFASVGPWSHRGINTYSNDLWGSIEFQFEAAMEALAMFGAGMRLSIWFVWLTALVLGCAALGARVLLKYVNHEQH